MSNNLMIKTYITPLTDLALHATPSRHGLVTPSLRLAVLQPRNAALWSKCWRENPEMVVGSQQLEAAGELAGNIEGQADCGTGEGLYHSVC